MQDNVYLEHVHIALPRLLSMFDVNPISPLLGVGDRYHWAWKGTDFANGTFQGAVHGLAVLVAEDMLPKRICQRAMISRIHSLIRAIPSITASNGSLNEILPFESSYCVTALVLFDALRALDTIEPVVELDEGSLIEALEPLAAFLLSNQERHGVISNHLAVAAAALARWHRRSGDQNAQQVALDTADIISSNGSSEGWFLEYSGADAGYQTLALDYLADLTEVLPETNQTFDLERACDFLSYFAHRDGSFGGLCGARNTRFLYPAGLEALAAKNQRGAAAAIAAFARQSHVNLQTVGLLAMDTPNLVPMFNSFCRAAVSLKKQTASKGFQTDAWKRLPCFSDVSFRKSFNDAGVAIVSRPRTYLVINWKKGGAFVASEKVKPGSCKSSQLADGGPSAEKPGKSVVYVPTSDHSRNRLISFSEDEIQLETVLVPCATVFPTPFHTIILRVLCLTFLRVAILNAWTKKALVWLLISNTGPSIATCRRTINYTSHVTITDVMSQKQSGDIRLRQTPSSFSAIHMASQGYWQIGDDQ